MRRPPFVNFPLPFRPSPSTLSPTAGGSMSAAGTEGSGAPLPSPPPSVRFGARDPLLLRRRDARAVPAPLARAVRRGSPPVLVRRAVTLLGRRRARTWASIFDIRLPPTTLRAMSSKRHRMRVRQRHRRRADKARRGGTQREPDARSAGLPSFLETRKVDRRRGRHPPSLIWKQRR